MKTYVELKVPLVNSARWLAELKKELHDLPVRWQNGFYHITVAFITEVPENVDVSKILAERLQNVEAPMVTFDKLDAFTISDNGMHMIYLTASNPSNELTSLIDSIGLPQSRRERLRHAPRHHQQSAPPSHGASRLPRRRLHLQLGYSIDYTPEQQMEYEKMISDRYEVDPKYFEEKYGMPVGAPKQSGGLMAKGPSDFFA